MFGLEILGSVALCILVSLIVIILALRSYNQTDIILPKEDVKPKIKTTKKSLKTKTAKKESVKPVQPKKAIAELKTQISQKSLNKEKKPNVEIVGNVPPVDRPQMDTSVEWQHVSKPNKKVIKKENKVDVNEDKVVETIATVTKSAPVIDVEEQLIVEKITKPNKSHKNDAPKFTIQVQGAEKEIKNVTANQPEVNVQQKKEKVNVVEKTGDEMDLRRRIGELMSEVDRQKSLNNQQNKELEALKQKMMVCQSNEEKTMEELRKRNGSFDDIKQQFVIVQKELTKNIVHVQTVNREKEKMESRVQTLEKLNSQLIEKSEMFDRINAEKESLLGKLSTVEAEYKESKSKYNEVLHRMEMENSEKINQLQLERQRIQEQLVHVQTDLLENNSKVQTIQEELLHAKNTYTDLLNENMRLKNTCVTLETANESVIEERLSAATMRDKEISDRIEVISKELEALKAINEKLVEENDSLKVQREDQTVDNTLQEKLASITQELEHAKRLIQTNSENSAESSEKLMAEVNDLRTEKDRLLSLAEHYKTELENTESALLQLQNSFTEEENRWRESLIKIEDEAETKVTSLTQELNVANGLVAEMRNSTITSANDTCDKLSSEINILRSEKDSLLSLVEHYKAGLENTESILCNLQISINDEEAKWRESLLKSENEADKCAKELEKVYNELMRIRNLKTDKNELNFAYHCVDRSLSSLIDEMETRMNQFEADLEAVIAERDVALAQVHAQMNGGSMSNDTVHTNNIEHNGNQYNDDDHSIMSQLKEELNTQMVLNNRLIDTSEKYESLINSGNDALEAEKSQVKTLKEELKFLKSKLSIEVSEQL